MIARKENGIITTYTDYPEDYNNILTFRDAPIEMKEANGFFVVIEPVLTPQDYYGQVIEVNGVFTFEVLKKYVPSAEELFDYNKFNNDLLTSFSTDIQAWTLYDSTMSNLLRNSNQADTPNVYKRSFTALNAYLKYLNATGVINNARLKVFYDTFLTQNIDLKLYV